MFFCFFFGPDSRNLLAFLSVSPFLSEGAFGCRGEGVYMRENGTICPFGVFCPGLQYFLLPNWPFSLENVVFWDKAGKKHQKDKWFHFQAATCTWSPGSPTLRKDVFLPSKHLLSAFYDNAPS